MEGENQIPSSLLKFNKENKKLITILSIDGGGVRCLISAIILRHLEKTLQDIDKNEDARLADYFDVIAGTNFGGVAAAMLTAPNENQRPLHSAKDIVEIYQKEFPKIFPNHSAGLMKKVLDYSVYAVKNLVTPKYNLDYLKNFMNQQFGEKKLNDTLTNLVIPTFDITKRQPVIFSSFQISDQPAINAKLSDICIGASATPTYLAPYTFENANKSFTLVDGGVVNTNPTLLALMEVSKNGMEDETINSHRMHDQKYLVISIGCGQASKGGEYEATKTAKWLPLTWMYNGDTTPLIDFLFESGADLVHRHNDVLFKSSVQNQDSYLRIQYKCLTRETRSLDLTTKENLETLEKIGNGWLLDSTTEDNIKRMAQKLSDERNSRKAQK